jgi:predicted nucleic acid-binding protein
MAVFLDTSYLLALELANDQNHARAQAHWRSVVQRLPALVTTTYVFDETVTFFNSRGHHAKAVQVGNNLLHSPSLQLIHVDEALFYAGWQFLERHQDKQYSLTDCISFVVMGQLGIDTVYTFDHHFTQAGFTQVP